MDIFVFKNPTATMLMQQGEIINGLTTKMWVERYAEAGEFTFTAPVSSGLREKLPIGAFVSHTDTEEIMIVENHEINGQQDDEDLITVTGRGFETYLENRIVGCDRNFPYISAVQKFTIPSNKIWDQIVYLINRHISEPSLIDPNNAIPYVTTQTDITGAATAISRKVEIRDVYSVILELMNTANIGIKVIRPGVWSPITNSQNVGILIHKGVDRTKELSFSYDTGEIVSADYLWSNKTHKTSAIITGKWIQTVVHTFGKTNYQRRFMTLTSNADEEWDVAPDDFAAGILVDNMKQEGREALAAQKDTVLTKAETSKQSVDSRYRVNYNVGDLVSVVGDYNESSVMRVSEFVEIEDENGTTAYPTLILNDETGEIS